MTTPSLFPPAGDVLSVGQLNRNVRRLLEEQLPLAWIGGEVSNLTRAASGHWYFVLKDAEAQVRCVMFRGRNACVDWPVRDGDQVELRALATLYEARGEFQLNVEFMRRAGAGALFEAFERLKRKLESEGLFAAARKRPLPRFPARIGLVTSPAAAALRDVLSTLARRMPSIPLVLYPTPVQGAEAAAGIVAALKAAARRDECDLLIVCRGGGGIEDLWPFNEESVARAIAASPIPVISGVGHETDFTIADFVADRRAPTPTAAAEMAAPDRAELARRLTALQRALSHRLRRDLEARVQRLDGLGRRLVHPGERLRGQRQHLDHLRQRLESALRRPLDAARWREQTIAGRLPAAMAALLGHRGERLQALARGLGHLDPNAVLERGYSLVRGENGELVRDAALLAAGEALEISFARGRALATVQRTTTGKS